MENKILMKFYWILLVVILVFMGVTFFMDDNMTNTKYKTAEEIKTQLDIVHNGDTIDFTDTAKIRSVINELEPKEIKEIFEAYQELTSFKYSYINQDIIMIIMFVLVTTFLVIGSLVSKYKFGRYLNLVFAFASFCYLIKLIIETIKDWNFYFN